MTTTALAFDSVKDVVTATLKSVDASEADTGRFKHITASTSRPASAATAALAPIARFIDHTALKPETSEAQVLQLCAEAVKHGFAAVCVAPHHAALAAKQLAGQQRVRVAAVLGFPHGDTLPSVKAFEASQLKSAGVHEVDMVLNVSMLCDGRLLDVLADIRGVVTASGVPVKVILECGLLTQTQIVQACVLSVLAGAAFVKTSTGFTYNGAKAARTQDVALMRLVVGEHAQVKASGGVKTLADAHAMIKAGATRIGASAGIALAAEEASAS